MVKKSLWAMVSFLMALSLLMASCSQSSESITPAPSAAPTSAGATSSPTNPTVSPVQEVTASPTTPKYGGIIDTWSQSDPSAFDPGVVMSILTQSIYYTHDKLLQGDWGKGPAGTGATEWLNYLGCNFNLLGGAIAESFELPDDETIVFHIRKGAHFWDKPPVNGREITADDVVYSINREWNYPKSFNRVTWSTDAMPKSVTATDKYTVELKVPAAVQGQHVLGTGSLVYIVPHEVIEQYGDFQDWHVMVGSGPWILTDYVVSSALTFKKNPDYWQMDPNHPENQLPYADGMKRLIIPDPSTKLAAFRTGKIDYIQGVSIDDYELMHREHPELEYKQMYGQVRNLVCRVDKPELPFDDLRVRWAMNLAIDQQAILDGYYKGQGELLSWPWYSWKEHERAYIPLDELPADAQQLFTYNPDKARQLLAEAGYPEGFKTKIDCENTQVDLVSIAREYLLKVGIDMEILPHEYSIYTSIDRGRTHEEMEFKVTKMFFIPWMMHEVRIESFDDTAYYENERTRAAYNELMLYLGKDENKAWQILKDITPFMIEQCPVGAYMPVPYNYDMWWPWIQNYFAATRMGYWEPETNLKYAWLDQEMKKMMGY